MSRLARWLWETEGRSARLARLALSPAALGVGAVAAMRSSVYRSGGRRRVTLPRPVVSVGNLSVGGTGKTPLASWAGNFFAGRGVRPAILLRGYGHDEGDIHRRTVPGAIVIEDADRAAAGRRAADAGADVIILDDGFQRLDVERDLDIVLVAAESLSGSRWILPAGPWREGWNALERADLAVVTSKRAGHEAVARTHRRVRAAVRPGCAVGSASLRISALEGLTIGGSLDPRLLQGASVLASAGVADPASLVHQLRDLGARVELLAWPNHHAYRPADLDRIVRVGSHADFVVVTEKDATKLRSVWPEGARDPLVVRLQVIWEEGREVVEEALRRALCGPLVPRGEAIEPSELNEAARADANL